MRAIASSSLLGIVICVSCAAGDAEFSETVRVFDNERGSVSQFYDLPYSQQRMDRMESLYREWMDKLQKVDFENLSQSGRVDYVLMRTKIEHELARIQRERGRLAEIDELMPFRTALQTFESNRWRMKTVDAPATATQISEISDQVKKLRERIEKGRKNKEKDAAKKDRKDSAVEAPAESKENEGKEKEAEPAKEGEKKADEVPPIKLSPTVALRAAKAIDELRRVFKTWFTYYDGYQPDFSWWMKRPYDESSKALEEYSKYLREELAGMKGKDEDPLLGDALGTQDLSRDIAAEFLPYTAEELLAIGEREFAWCEARMKETAREMGLGDDWKKALAKVKNTYVAPGKQDEYVASQAADAIAFVKQHDLVTVPPLCEETWRITMIPPDGQKSVPYAAYGGMHMMVAYAKDDMKQADKMMSMRGNNMHFTRIVTAHELIPGHHLQSYQAQRFREYRRSFGTSFYVEGWALYWEMCLWDRGFARSPEDKIGMLFWRMHRAARIIVSLKFHLNQMTPQQMVDFLVDRVGHEKFGATSEVRRFISGDYSPLYQCGYMIGGLQLRALSKELVGGGKMTEKEFNDAVLKCGPIPIELVRAQLTNTPLTRESRPAWKFAN